MAEACTIKPTVDDDDDEAEDVYKNIIKHI